jgi:hypothetical protein
MEVLVMSKRRMVFSLLTLSTVFFLGSLSLQGAELESAYVKIFISTARDRTVDVHQVTSEWTELGVTWNNAPSFNPVPATSLLPDLNYQWYAIDVTSLVQEWLGGTSNHGIMLMEPDPDYPAQLFVSSNDDEPEYRPYLEVTFIEGGNPVTEVYPCLGDSYIYEYLSDTNYGTKTKILTGLKEPEIGYECRGLFLFELPDVTAGAEVDVDYMKVRDLKHCGSIFDKICIKGDIVLDPGADPFDPETDDVKLSMNGEDITIPAGSFEEKNCWGKHYFRFCGDLPCEGWAYMYLNFECESWWIGIWDIETADLAASEGVELTLGIGANVGEDGFDWSWKYENSCMTYAKYWD